MREEAQQTFFFLKSDFKANSIFPNNSSPTGRTVLYLLPPEPASFLRSAGRNGPSLLLINMELREKYKNYIYT